MTAMLLSSFRAGNLAEGIGLEMLRRFAAVAPVPRPEDVGIDATCTLFRSEQDRVFAEDTFAIQVKSESDQPLVLKPHGYEWLNRLDIPLFLMTVHLEETRARLYSFEWALAMGTMPGWTELFVDKPRRLESAFPAYPWLLSAQGKDPTFENTKEDPQRIWLGPMLAEFHLPQLNDDTVVRAIQTLLKGWCSSLTDLIYFRRQGIRYTLQWNTGTLPAVVYAEVNALAGDDAATTQTLRRIVPMIDLLSLQTDPSDVALAGALATIRQRADERGIPRLPGVHLQTKIVSKM